MNYWCFITTEYNWKICLGKNLFGLDYRYYQTWKNFVKKEDKAVIYVTKKGFVATAIVKGKKVDFKKIGWTRIYPYRILINIEEGKNVVKLAYSLKEDLKKKEKVVHVNPNFIDELIFVTDKSKSWSSFVYPSILTIPKEDFEKVKKGIK